MANTANPTNGPKQLAYGSLAVVTTTVFAALIVAISAFVAARGVYGLGVGIGLSTLALLTGTLLTRNFRTTS